VNDDWRIHVEVEEESAHGLFERLGLGHIGEEASELARELTNRRLVVSRDGEDIFVYAPTRADADKAHAVIEATLRELDIEARTSQVEHWIDEEDRWDDDPPGETWEEEEVDHGNAPWEVRIEAPSREQAHDLEQQLRAEGYEPVRSFEFVIVGTASREDAEALAARVHGTVEAGGATVWETAPGNPFAIFGGLGSSGTPGG
jgi:hypothetical protein